MAMFVGTFQHDSGLGEFCQSIASRALTLATNLSTSGISSIACCMTDNPSNIDELR
jgi:hypothetical protein